MSNDEIKVTEDRGAPVKTRRPRQPRKAKRGAQPITRSQGIAWGTLGVTLGNAITLAIAKWLGVY